MKRTLALKKDTLTELGREDLTSVVGGSAASCFTCFELKCVVEDVLRLTTVSGIERPALPSLDTPCG